jgi:LacI family transcriptional regulator
VTLRRYSIRDIAKLSKVSRTTVSLALRNHSSIPLSTRERIQKLAKKYHYRPDPILSALFSNRKSQKILPYRGSIAWVSSYEKREDQQISRISTQQVYQAAKARASEFGYQLEHFWLKQPKLTAAIATKILISRGIQGLIIGSNIQSRAHFSLEWKHFSVVAVGHTLNRPHFHRAASNVYQNMVTIIRKLRSLGYRRIGFVCDAVLVERTQRLPLGAFLAEQQQLMSPSDRITPLVKRNLTREDFTAWFQAKKPSAIIAGDSYIYDWLKEMNVKVPKNVGFAKLSVYKKNEFSGISLNSPVMGKAAIDLLLELFQHNERGIPEVPCTVLVDGYWVRGKTVRRVTSR